MRSNIVSRKPNERINRFRSRAMVFVAPVF
jgi:hypothetical protein